jgi:3-oxoacyl-ACP reductase-like protein
VIKSNMADKEKTQSVEEKRAQIEANVAAAKAKQRVDAAAAAMNKQVKRPAPLMDPLSTPTLWGVRVIVGVIVLFYSMRIPELISLVSRPLYVLMLAVSAIAIVTLIFRPPAMLGALAKRLGLVALVVASIKNDMDKRLGDVTEKHVWDLSDNYVVVVTGANSGVGLGTVKHLYQQGAHVVMTCRDLNRCAAAMKKVEEAKTLNRLYNVSHSTVCTETLVVLIFL